MVVERELSTDTKEELTLLKRLEREDIEVERSPGSAATAEASGLLSTSANELTVLVKRFVRELTALIRLLIS
jgi:hypothetical protein